MCPLKTNLKFKSPHLTTQPFFFFIINQLLFNYRHIVQGTHVPSLHSFTNVPDTHRDIRFVIGDIRFVIGDIRQPKATVCPLQTNLNFIITPLNNRILFSFSSSTNLFLTTDILLRGHTFPRFAHSTNVPNKQKPHRGHSFCYWGHSRSVCPPQTNLIFIITPLNDPTFFLFHHQPTLV